MPITLQDHTDVTHAGLDEKFPPVPPIKALDSHPPLESERIVLGTSSARIRLWANSGKETWVDDIPGSGNPMGAILLNYWDGGPPAAYTLTHRQYWRQVDGSYTQLPEGNSKTMKYTKTFGISQTDTETISAEMGVDAGGLSSKLSATFSHSVTTSAERSEEVTESVAAPKEGKIRAWMAWQLCDEIVALDPNGNLIATGDKGQSNRKAEIRWNFLSGDSGAWVWYRSARTVFPSNTIIYTQRDFPAT